MKYVWAVFQFDPDYNTMWGLIGIYDNIRPAIKACLDQHYCIAKLPVNKCLGTRLDAKDFKPWFPNLKR